MSYDEERDLFHYPCPCGDRFEITRLQLRDAEDVAKCPSCSLIIRVVFDPVRNGAKDMLAEPAPGDEADGLPFSSPASWTLRTTMKMQRRRSSRRPLLCRPSHRLCMSSRSSCGRGWRAPTDWDSVCHSLCYCTARRSLACLAAVALRSGWLAVRPARTCICPAPGRSHRTVFLPIALRLDTIVRVCLSLQKQRCILCFFTL